MGEILTRFPLEELIKFRDMNTAEQTLFKETTEGFSISDLITENAHRLPYATIEAFKDTVDLSQVITHIVEHADADLSKDTRLAVVKILKS